MSKHRVTFTRRRYGRRFFCWARLILPNGEPVELGDPWPGSSWPRGILRAEVERAVIEALEG